MNKNLSLFFVIGVVVLGGVIVWFNQRRGNNGQMGEGQPTAVLAENNGAPSAADAHSEHYQDYSPEAYAAAADKKRVLFFHAKWCPTCKAANLDIVKNADKLHDDIIVFKTDYDTQTELKKKYGIAYQHTYVWVDALGNQLKIWNGGGVDEINKNVF